MTVCETSQKSSRTVSVWQVSELRWVVIVFKSNRDMSSKIVSLWFEMYSPKPGEILRLTLSVLGSRRVKSVEEKITIFGGCFLVEERSH